MEWIDGRKTVLSSQRRDLRAIDSREGIRHHDETAIRFACLCDDSGFKLGGIADPCYDCLDCEGCSSGLERGQEIFGIWRCRWIEQYGALGDSRRNFFE